MRILACVQIRARALSWRTTRGLQDRAHRGPQRSGAFVSFTVAFLSITPSYESRAIHGWDLEMFSVNEYAKDKWAKDLASIDHAHHSADLIGKTPRRAVVWVNVTNSRPVRRGLNSKLARLVTQTLQSLRCTASPSHLHQGQGKRHSSRAPSLRHARERSARASVLARGARV